MSLVTSSQDTKWRFGTQQIGKIVLPFLPKYRLGHPLHIYYIILKVFLDQSIQKHFTEFWKRKHWSGIYWWFVIKLPHQLNTIWLLILESPWTKKTVSTGALNSFDDPSVVQTTCWMNGWVSVDNTDHLWCWLICWDLPIAQRNSNCGDSIISQFKLRLGRFSHVIDIFGN